MSAPLITGEYVMGGRSVDTPMTEYDIAVAAICELGYPSLAVFLVRINDGDVCMRATNEPIYDRMLNRVWQMVMEFRSQHPNESETS